MSPHTPAKADSKSASPKATLRSKAGLKASSKAAHGAPAAPAIPTLFLPTLLPSLLEESSPELCWEWKSGDARVAARLTQFGWNASAYAAGSAVGHWRADSLEELRAAVLSSSLPPAFISALSAPWTLAYDVAGFS